MLPFVIDINWQVIFSFKFDNFVAAQAGAAAVYVFLYKKSGTRIGATFALACFVSKYKSLFDIG